MIYQNYNDETLVMLTLAGDEKAYEMLVMRWERKVIATALSVTHSRFMAEDAAQDAFVTAWMKLDALHEQNKFGSWVCRIAKNCALNTVMRYKSFLPLEDIENVNIQGERSENPAQICAAAEENEEIYKSIDKLPKKVGEVIRLHYFEGLSIVEIADRMRISQGTVKWQLHDGRKRMRKELCAMDEKWNDTLLQRVMKKVEEIKLWQMNNSKNGFEAVYKDVLAEVEELPESQKKYHAMADVLLRGWWWIPGAENDELFARIKEAARLGKNDDVMAFIAAREDSQVAEPARAEFIRDKQIPSLLEQGFTRAAAKEWISLAGIYLYGQDGFVQNYRSHDIEKGAEALSNARALLSADEAEYILSKYEEELYRTAKEKYEGRDMDTFRMRAASNEVHFACGDIRHFDQQSNGIGYLNSVERMLPCILRDASRCDGYYFKNDMKVGDTYVGTDESTLSFEAEGLTVETPCGTFEGCQLWKVRYSGDYTTTVYNTWYKEDVGIVKHECICDSVPSVCVLKAYDVRGGGLLPIEKGNAWEYDLGFDARIVSSEVKLTVEYADKSKAIIVTTDEMVRHKYDENSWQEAIEEIRNEYFKYDKNGRNGKVHDVSAAIARAEALAKTPMEKVHTKFAADVARRIMETDPEFNPNHTATGHWNFFSRNHIETRKGITKKGYNGRWSFELKNTGGYGEADTPLLHNDIYGMLQDATNCIWNEEWRVGASPVVEYTLWGSKKIKTQIICEDAGTITTKAGTFENCLKLSMDISGLDGGHAYRGGKKEYYFAYGVGIVRTVNEIAEDVTTSVYELSSFEGTGEGYMPFENGMKRRYEAIGLTDGFVGGAEYEYVESEYGEMIIFSNRKGIRVLPPPVTQYSFIQRERDEEKLWDEGKRDDARQHHAVNNFHLILHFMGRNNYNLARPDKAVAWSKYRIAMLENMFMTDGKMARAWLGLYADLHFAVGTASFGLKTPEGKEEGYAYLEKAFELYPEWLAIPDGEALEVGDELIYGGVKVVKGKGYIEAPDIGKESIAISWFFNYKKDRMYNGMTAKKGWEWFNSVRNEPRFNEYIERAKKLMEE